MSSCQAQSRLPHPRAAALRAAPHQTPLSHQTRCGPEGGEHGFGGDGRAQRGREGASSDFKGNLLADTRRLAKDYQAAVDWVALADPDATPAELATAAESLLESETFEHSYVFDALNRPTSVVLPDSTDVRAGFDIAGLLVSVAAYLRGAGGDPTPFVNSIVRDEHGRRKSITYANGTETRYQYDPLSRRLTHFETERGATSPATYLQKLDYFYDAEGNITRLKDSATQSAFFEASSVESADRDFTYSALYRLIAAEGREHGSGAGDEVQLDEDERHPWGEIPHPNDANGFWRYEEAYSYDQVGNILALVHSVDQPFVPSWTREYTYEDAPDCNRLVSTKKGGSWRDYEHDEHGNMVSMPHLETMEWDHNDQLQHVDKGNNTGQETWFTYDSTGERVRKVYEHEGLREERIYLGGYEIYRKSTVAGPTVTLQEERQTVHIADDQRRIAMVESLTTSGGTAVDPGDVVPRIRCQLDDHLGTACVEVDGDGNVISFEEYHPFGTTSYHSWDSGAEVSAKRYRYTGKERDEETGLSYHGARYYCSWLGRWTSADPAGLVDGANLYGYCRGDPVGASDRSGLDDDDIFGVKAALQVMQKATAEIIADREPPPPAGISRVRNSSSAGGPMGIASMPKPDSGPSFWTVVGVGAVVLATGGLVAAALGTSVLAMPVVASASGGFGGSAAGVGAGTALATTGPGALATVARAAAPMIPYAAPIAAGLKLGVEALQSGGGEAIVQAGEELVEESEPVQHEVSHALKDVDPRTVSQVSPTATNLPPTAGEGAASRLVHFAERDLQKVFTKHGADFGLSGNWSPSRAADISRAIHEHINDPVVRAIQGTYRNTTQVTHYYNPATTVDVMVDAAGKLVGWWKLSIPQVEHLLQSGNIQ